MSGTEASDPHRRKMAGCRAVNDLLHHLVGQRAHLIAKMSVYLVDGGDVAGWLPLLARTQVAIEAVEAAMRESLTPG